MCIIARSRKPVLAAAILFAAWTAGTPAAAAPNLNDLKVRMHEACDLARILGVNWWGGPWGDDESKAIAFARARTDCFERKHAFLQALADQLVEAWLTEPPPQTTRTTRRPSGTTRGPPSRTTVVRPPPRQQYDPQAAAAATGALIGIIGGVIAGSGAGHHHHHHGPTVRGGGPGRPAGTWGGRRPIP